jgi:hypothetical protein
VAAVPTVAEETGRRTLSPVPNEEKYQKALAEIKEIFKQEYASATTPDQRRSLAELLHKQAVKSEDDRLVRFVLLQQAFDCATAAGDLPLSERITSQLTTEYEIDDLQMRVHMLKRVLDVSRPVSGSEEIAGRALTLAEQATRDRRFEEAEQLTRLAKSVATRARNPDLRRRAAAVSDDVDQASRDWETLQRAIEILTDKPEDPLANLIYGKHLCLVENNWHEGLPSLAKGSDDAIKAAAVADLAEPTEVEGRIQVADMWHDVAGREASLEGFRVRARKWYSEALPDAVGLSRLKAERRLEAIREAVPETVVSPTKPVPRAKEAARPKAPRQLREVLRLPHDWRVGSVGFSPDGRILITCCGSSVYLWERESGKKLAQLTGPKGKGEVTNAAILPDGKRLVLSTFIGVIQVLDIETGSEVVSIVTGDIRTYDMAVSPDGRACVSGGTNGSVQVWNLDEGIEKQCFKTPGDRVFAVAYSADGLHVGSATFDENPAACLLRIDSGREVQKYGTRGYWDIALTRDGNHVVAGSSHGLFIWDRRTAQQIHHISKPAVYQLAISPDDRFIATGCLDRTVCLWELKTGRQICAFRDDEAAVKSVAFSPDGLAILTGGVMGLFDRAPVHHARLWSLPAQFASRKLKGR